MASQCCWQYACGLAFAMRTWLLSTVQRCSPPLAPPIGLTFFLMGLLPLLLCACTQQVFWT